jgi:transposase-like protein
VEVKNVSILVAIGVNEEGYREVLGVMKGAKDAAHKKAEDSRVNHPQLTQGECAAHWFKG